MQETDNNMLSSSEGNLETSSGSTVQHFVALHQQYEGPLPPASELNHYESVMPGLAERIVRLTEEEAAHRRSIETRSCTLIEWETKSQTALKRHAQIFAFIIALSGIFSGVYAMLNGANWSGTGLSISTLGAIVTAFLVKNRKTTETIKTEHKNAPAKTRKRTPKK